MSSSPRRSRRSKSRSALLRQSQSSSPTRSRRANPSRPNPSPLGLVYARPPTPYYPKPYRRAETPGLVRDTITTVSDFYATRLCSMIYLLFFTANTVSFILSFEDAMLMLPLSMFILHHLHMVGTYTTAMFVIITHVLIAIHSRLAFYITLTHAIFYTSIVYLYEAE